VRTAVGLQGLRALREAAVRPGVRFLFWMSVQKYHFT